MTADHDIETASRPQIRSGTGADQASQPSLRATTNVAVWGHLYWLSFVWAGALLVLVAVLGGMWWRDGALDASVWEQIGVGVVRWLFLAAGISIASSYIPLFVTNGVTRARLSSASIASMVVLSVIGAAVVAVGFVVERLLAAGAGWHVALVDDGPPLDAGTIATRVMAVLALFAAYFVSGWLIGLGFYRYSTSAGIALIAPSMIPAIVVGVLVDGAGNVIGVVGTVEEWLEPVAGLRSPVAIPVAAVVVAAACVVARTATRRTPVR